MLRIAMLGFAHVHANGYADYVRNHAEAEIACIWDDDPERLKTACKKYGVGGSGFLEAVLSRDDVDAVVVNAPTSQHFEVISAAIKHKKHVFTEKALTIATPESDELVCMVNDSGIKFMISLPSRTRPEILFMKQVLDRGLLGDITLMRARVAHCASLDHWFGGGSAWFADAELAGGGALFDLGCHTTDVMRWLMGEPVSVVSKVQQFSDAYAIDDNSVAVIEFKNHALGILDTSWVHRTGPNPYEIYGTKGYMSLGAAPGSGLMIESTELSADGIEGLIKPSNLPASLPMPMDQWIGAILHNKEMFISVEDGRNLTQLLDGIYISAREAKEYRF